MTTARRAAAAAIARQAPHFPQMPPVSVDTAGLDPRDARLAHAIQRVTLQRFITLEHLLEGRLKRPLASLEPRLQAILLSGAAQLLFMEKLPAHGVVNESVDIAKHQMRQGAGKLVNAVLRKIDSLVALRRLDVPWTPAAAQLPTDRGHIVLIDKMLLPPLSRLDEYLSIATSHPIELVHAWQETFGDDQATELLLHSLQHAPLIVHTDPARELDPDLAEPHEQPGFWVWRGDHAALLELLNSAETAWVQDPTSSVPVTSTAHLAPQHILDFCAGRGTKTRQLAHTHPAARVTATDPDRHRFADLQCSFSDHPNVTVIPFDRVHELDGRIDLLVLDVPCSNTGVLARRLEARYRYDEATLRSVTQLQRSIIDDAAPLLRRAAVGKPDAAVLYSTCSIEPAENLQQAQWAAQLMRLRIKHHQTILPGGSETSYHDGGFHALLV